MCAGDGLSEILKNTGIDFIIEGGQTRNRSEITEDILDAVKKVNADHVFVFPNNKNIILAAEQARDLSDKNIIVMKSKNIPQCIRDALEYNANRNIEDNIRKATAMDNAIVGQETFAVRDTEMDGVSIAEETYS